MKQRIRMGVVFGLIMSAVFCCTNLLSADQLNGAGTRKVVAASVFAGLFSGMLFAFFLGRFSRGKFKNQDH